MTVLSRPCFATGDIIKINYVLGVGKKSIVKGGNENTTIQGYGLGGVGASSENTMQFTRCLVTRKRTKYPRQLIVVKMQM